MLLDIATLCIIPAAVLALWLLPWTDAEIQRVQSTADGVWARLRWLLR